MKAILLTFGVFFAAADLSRAGSIEGRVIDGSGNPRSEVTISVKGYRQTTTTDANGYYVLRMPPAADGVRVDVRVAGLFAVNCLVPIGNAASKVMITLIRG